MPRQEAEKRAMELLAQVGLTDKAKSSTDKILKQLDKYTGKNIGEAIYGN